jgi:hypothetical protein
MRPIRVIAVLALFAVASAAMSAGEAARRTKKQDDAAPVATPGDKRDRMVAAPGTPFNGRAYWQANAQCGGIYFRLNTLYAEAAITAKVTKPDPAAYTRFSKAADGASTYATAFFEAAEQFLVADRKLARQEAVLTYDAVAQTTGERLKSIDAALQATKPCPELYKACRGAFPQICTETAALTN